jgi:DmsE family decaheme c-type cytochrome
MMFGESNWRGKSMKKKGKAVLWVLGALLLSAPAWAADSKSASFAGSEACVSCHDKQAASINRSIHWKKAVKEAPVNAQGCESCHGSGTAHVDKGGGKGVGGLTSFSKAESAAQRSASCLQCHDDSKVMSNWNLGRHKTAGVSCDSCHSAHSGKKYLTKAAEPALCLSCHQGIKAKMNRQSHHPVYEGKVKCTDCHNPHGGFDNKMIRGDSVSDLCYKCHADKRGPYAFEHPPVVENCLTCHDVHGSNHDNLLVAKPPRLCQTCHVNSGHNNRPYSFQNSFSGSATGSKPRFLSKGCVNCHGNIHGSNRSPDFER